MKKPCKIFSFIVNLFKYNTVYNISILNVFKFKYKILKPKNYQ